ncbi:DUF4124 domain-containing protein [Pseudomonas subflava]|uniref:DUF4124 domain-containing protein n=1 Tax=Pseudomonas subflava TaxID=2952933 RepID=UPI002079C65C|nr:DUF4124 domain-containing protein [Pseudomonas subflava]
MRHLIFIALLVPGLAGAEIYRWTDAQGRVHFGEKPGGNGAEQVQVKPQVVERDEATRQREQRTQQYFDARRDERAAADARAAEVHAERSKECGELRNSLAQIQRGGRYFTTDAAGERQYIDEADVEAARSRLSSRIAERCG